MCEDFPCCGHERGCCPDYDEAGRQLNMKCTCGATLPINSRYSICDSCLNGPDEDGYYDPYDDIETSDEYERDYEDDIEDMEDDWPFDEREYDENGKFIG